MSLAVPSHTAGSRPGTHPTETPGVRPVTRAELGGSWRPGCPVGPDELRAVSVRYVGFDGAAHLGTIVVAASVAANAQGIFSRLYLLRFPIARITPVAAYEGNDESSMEADNTSAFNCRPVTGGGGWSEHAYGLAVDLNPLENPYVAGTTVQPRTARPYVDRDQDLPGMIHSGDPVVTAFAAAGWQWGGGWHDPIDWQHFQR